MSCTASVNFLIAGLTADRVTSRAGQDIPVEVEEGGTEGLHLLDSLHKDLPDTW